MKNSIRNDLNISNNQNGNSSFFRDKQVQNNTLNDPMKVKLFLRQQNDLRRIDNMEITTFQPESTYNNKPSQKNKLNLDNTQPIQKKQKFKPKIEKEERLSDSFEVPSYQSITLQKDTKNGIKTNNQQKLLSESFYLHVEGGLNKNSVNGKARAKHDKTAKQHRGRKVKKYDYYQDLIAQMNLTSRHPASFKNTFFATQAYSSSQMSHSKGSRAFSPSIHPQDNSKTFQKEKLHKSPYVRNPYFKQHKELILHNPYQQAKANPSLLLNAYLPYTKKLFYNPKLPQNPSQYQQNKSQQTSHLSPLHVKDVKYVNAKRKNHEFSHKLDNFNCVQGNYFLNINLLINSNVSHQTNINQTRDDMRKKYSSPSPPPQLSSNSKLKNINVVDSYYAKQQQYIPNQSKKDTLEKWNIKNLKGQPPLFIKTLALQQQQQQMNDKSFIYKQNINTKYAKKGAYLMPSIKAQRMFSP